MWRLIRRHRGRRSQVQPRDVLCCCCFGRVGIKMAVSLDRSSSAVTCACTMCHLPWSYCRAEQQTSGFQIAAEFCVQGGLRQSQWLAVDGDTVACLLAPACVSLPGQPRDDGEVDVGRGSTNKSRQSGRPGIKRVVCQDEARTSQSAVNGICSRCAGASGDVTAPSPRIEAVAVVPSSWVGMGR